MQEVVQGRKVKPAHCYGTLDLQMAFCCPIPPFFAKEIALVCGVHAGVVEKNIPGTNITGLARIGLTCEQWTCILMRYRIYTAENLQDETVDEYRMYDHLDRWLELNPEFKRAIFKAKIVCKEGLAPLMPLQICMFKQYIQCLRNYLKLDCPPAIMVKTKICQKQKEFYDECREFFY
ncbi:uncharacterized protein LOC126371543 [Pectinophora gossypiella]|uniref:uncharacterized protein LOC126371543 n=1 Tax=Pectinophora gossypiella TaxID=13191 RepID=UPI00214F06C8|nr:uncharacterized protein LOC126371543 [Pectinophora gossypiella]